MNQHGRLFWEIIEKLEYRNEQITRRKSKSRKLGSIKSIRITKQILTLDNKNTSQGESAISSKLDETNKSEQNVDPLLFVDVNLGPDKTERIVVYPGDTAEALADKFAKEHSKQLNTEIDQNLKTKLIIMLKQQMSSLLEKIDEEEVTTTE